MFAAKDLFAFTCRAACNNSEHLWIKVRAAMCTRKGLFKHIRTVTDYFALPLRDALLRMLIAPSHRPKLKLKSLCNISRQPD